MMQSPLEHDPLTERIVNAVHCATTNEIAGTVQHVVSVLAAQPVILCLIVIGLAGWIILAYSTLYKFWIR